MGSQKVAMKVAPDNSVSYFFFSLFMVAQTHPSGYLEPPSSDLSTLTPADIEGRVRSLEQIFKSVNVSSDGCKNMLVCLLAKNEVEFSHLSQKVMDLLKVNTSLVTQYELLYLERTSKELENTVLYLNLLQAVHSGSHQQSCDKFSSVCEYQGENMITEDRILAWKLMYQLGLQSLTSF